MTVEAIKDAIQQLPEEERTSLAAWLNEMEYDEWDKEMVTDFSPGGHALTSSKKCSVRSPKASACKKLLVGARERRLPRARGSQWQRLRLVLDRLPRRIHATHQGVVSTVAEGEPQ